MKWIKGNKREGDIIRVGYTPSDDERTMDIRVPRDHPEWWFPLDVNCYYIYTPSQKKVYLTKTNGSLRPSYYDIELVKNAKPFKPMEDHYVPSVHERNKEVMLFASDMGIPTFEDLEYLQNIHKEKALDIITNGFMKVGDWMDQIIEQTNGRYEQEHPNPLAERFRQTDVWHRESFKYMTAWEEDDLHIQGEIRVMLNMMRKLIK